MSDDNSENQNNKKPLFATGHDGSTFDVGSFFTRDYFDDLLIWAASKKASDITLETGKPGLAEIGGKNYNITGRDLSHAELDDVVRYVYAENGPAELAGGFDLDPSHEVTINGEMHRYRVNITGGRAAGGNKGFQLTIRTLPAEPLPIEGLNIEKDIIQNWRPEQGLVLVTGPTGSGKSTLLSSGTRMLLENPNGNEKILEYSRPIEFVYDKIIMPSSSIHQVEVGKHLRPRDTSIHEENSVFAHATRNALRRKPTIIIIGEARDRATIEAVVEASLTGHLVYSTMHTIGVGETLRRAVMPFPESIRRAMAVDIMESLRMIVSQTLLTSKKGGKVGCREYMIFGREIRELFLKEHIDNWPRLSRRLLAEERALGSTMAKSALKLLWNGDIDEKTYERVAGKSKNL